MEIIFKTEELLMSTMIDLSVFKQDDIEIKSLNGTIYTIPGNFTTEFYLSLYNAQMKIEKINKKNEFESYLQIMKEIALEIIKLDTSKSVTMETINSEFNDIKVLEALLGIIMKQSSEISNNPNLQSPTSN